MSKNDDLIQDLKNDAQDIAGASAGALIGFASGGPIGAIIGSVMPIVIDAAQRLTGRRRKKVAALVAFTVSKIDEHLDSGKEIRNDGFFSDNRDAPSSAFEIWERAINFAENESEQKKLKYIANLIANISFEPSISQPQANELLKIAESLSYQQLSLLQIFANQPIKLSLRDGDYRGQKENFTFDKLSVLTEVLELHRYGIIIMPNDTMLGISDVNPRKIDLLGIGKSLFRLMELHQIPVDDLSYSINHLKD